MNANEASNLVEPCSNPSVNNSQLINMLPNFNQYEIPQQQQQNDQIHLSVLHNNYQDILSTQPMIQAHSKEVKSKSTRQIAAKSHFCLLCPSRYTQEKALRDHITKKHPGQAIPSKGNNDVSIQPLHFSQISNDQTQLIPEIATESKSGSRKRVYPTKAKTRKISDQPSTGMDIGHSSSLGPIHPQINSQGGFAPINSQFQMLPQSAHFFSTKRPHIQQQYCQQAAQTLPNSVGHNIVQNEYFNSSQQFLNTARWQNPLMPAQMSDLNEFDDANIKQQQSWTPSLKPQVVRSMTLNGLCVQNPHPEYIVQRGRRAMAENQQNFEATNAHVYSNSSQIFQQSNSEFFTQNDCPIEPNSNMFYSQSEAPFYLQSVQNTEVHQTNETSSNQLMYQQQQQQQQQQQNSYSSELSEQPETFDSTISNIEDETSLNYGCLRDEVLLELYDRHIESTEDSSTSLQQNNIVDCLEQMVNCAESSSADSGLGSGSEPASLSLSSIDLNSLPTSVAPNHFYNTPTQSSANTPLPEQLSTNIPNDNQEICRLASSVDSGIFTSPGSSCCSQQDQSVSLPLPSHSSNIYLNQSASNAFYDASGTSASLVHSSPNVCRLSRGHILNQSIPQNTGYFFAQRISGQPQQVIVRMPTQQSTIGQDFLLTSNRYPQQHFPRAYNNIGSIRSGMMSTEQLLSGNGLPPSGNTTFIESPRPLGTMLVTSSAPNSFEQHKYLMSQCLMGKSLPYEHVSVESDLKNFYYEHQQPSPVALAPQKEEAPLLDSVSSPNQAPVVKNSAS